MNSYLQVATPISFNRLWLPVLEQLYPAQQEKNEPSAWLHYQTVHHREAGSNAKIIAQMESTKKHLCFKHPNSGLFPAMLMAMLGRVQLLKKLIELISREEAQTSLRSRDQFGWTAMHFIVLTMDFDLLAYFAERGGDLAALNNLYGTPEDVAVLAGRLQRASWSAPHTYIKCPDGRERRVSEISNDIFETVVSPWKALRDLPIYTTPESVFQLWEQQQSDEKDNEYTALFRKARTNPTAISIHLHHEIPGHIGVYTMHSTPAMTVLCVYGGEMPFPRSGSMGLEGFEDADKQGSVTPYHFTARGKSVAAPGSRINCGLPNIVIRQVEDQGTPQHIYIDPCGLPAHKELLVTYGPSFYWWLQAAKILDWTRYEVFFEGGLKAAAKRIEQAAKDPCGGDFIKWNSQRQLRGSQAIFPLEFPVALLKLYLCEIVPDVKEWKKVLEGSKDSPYNKLELHTPKCAQGLFKTLLGKWFDSILDYDNAVQKTPPEIKRAFDLWLLDYVEKLPPTALVKALMEMTQQCKSHLHDIAAAETFLQQLTDQLATYEWRQDPDNPFKTPINKKSPLLLSRLHPDSEDPIARQMGKDGGFLKSVSDALKNRNTPPEEKPKPVAKKMPIKASPSLIYLQWLDALKGQYPPEAYKSSAENLKFHFLCIYNRSSELEKTLIDRINASENIETLTYVDAKTKVDLVMICAMTGRTAVMEALLKKLPPEQRKTALNRVFMNGWTAVHFAAVTMPNLLPTLIEMGGDPNKLTKLGGSPEHIGRLAGAIDAPSRSAQQVMVQQQNGTFRPIRELSADDLSALVPGMKTYRDLPRYPNVHTLAQLEPIKSSAVISLLKNEIAQWEKSPPNLYIAPSNGGGVGVYTSHASVGLRVMGTFGGVHFQPKLVGSSLEAQYESYLKKTISSFSFSDIDGEVEGGIGSRFIHGWPNLLSLPADKDGAPQNFFVSPGKLKAHELLMWNHGPVVRLFFRKIHLYHWDLISDFFQGGLFTTLQRSANIELVSDYTPKDLQFKKLLAIDRAVFPICTPSAVLKLHLSGIVNAREWQTAIKNEHYERIGQIIAPLKQSAPQYFFLFDEWCNIINRFQQLTGKADELVRQELTTWLLDYNERIPPLHTAKALQMITKRLVDGQLTNDSVTAFLQELTHELQSYDWLRDKERPFKDTDDKK